MQGGWLKRGSAARTVCIALASALSVASHAQPSASEETADPLSGRASVGYLATQGNTEGTNVNAKLRLLYSFAEWTHEADTSAIAASRDDETTAEAYAFAYRARRDVGERGYLVTVLDSQRDRFSAYQYQISESIGYGRRIVDGTAHTFSLEVGAGAVQARRVDRTSADEAIGRGSLRYQWRLNDTTSLHQDLVVESGAANTRTESQTELRARLFSNVGLVLSYRVRRNTDVLPGRQRSDMFSAVSLEYAF